MTVSNGGVIGKLNSASYSVANGVFNIREQEQSRRLDKWPEVIEVSVTPSVTAVNESETVTFDVIAKGIANGTTLYWSTNGFGLIAQGQATYTIPGTYSWTAPENVKSVSVVCVGGGGSGSLAYTSGGSGGGGGGGALAYSNNIPVVPGQTYSVVVGAGGQSPGSDSGTTNLAGFSGESSSFNGTTVVAGGGQGGGAPTASAGGAGGAGGVVLSDPGIPIVLQEESYLFDGNSYISVPDSVAWELGTSNFTIECWVYGSNTSGYIFNQVSTVGGERINLRIVSPGIINFRVRSNSIYEIDFSTASNMLPANTWTHIAVVRNGSSFTIYINGVSSATTTSSFSIPNISSTLNISDAAAYYTGYISNFRWVKGTAVYTTNFTPPTTPLTAIANTSLLMAQDLFFQDNSINNFALTVNGNTRITDFSPFAREIQSFATHSAYFDGTGDVVYVEASAPIILNNDYTVEAWIWLDVDNLVYPIVFSSGTFYLRFGDTGFGWKLHAATVETGLTTIYSCSLTQTDAVKRWTHVALTRQNGVNRLFVNGVQQNLNTGANPTTYPLTSWTDSATVGGSTWYIGYALNGNISNFRVVKGTALYTASFTPSTQPLTAVVGTSLLTLQNKQPTNNSVFMDSSSNNLSVNIAGNTKPSTLGPYLTSWSNYFDGTVDYLSIPYNSNFDLIPGSWTFDCWVFPTATKSASRIFSTGGGTVGWNSTTGIHTLIGLSNTNLVGVQLATGTSTPTVVYNPTTVNLNTWNHIAVCVDTANSKVRVFLNGVMAESTYTTYSRPSTNPTLTIGTINGEAGDINTAYQGHISNLRIVKGTALYTADFTPPTQPLTAIAGTSLLTCADNRFIDDSTNNFTITRTGNVAVSSFSPFLEPVTTFGNGGAGGNGGGITGIYGGPPGGGGGAGGYSGNGGAGGTPPTDSSAQAGQAAPAGGGAGGGSTGVVTNGGYRISAASGGGVGILGQGLSGGATTTPVFLQDNNTVYGGFAGSQGTSGQNITSGAAYSSGGMPGVYGGGSGGMYVTSTVEPGGSGAVRILWGLTREFPDTNTIDLFTPIYDSSDFASQTAEGSFTVVKHGGQISRAIAFKADSISEPEEAFSISVRTGSTAGPILATSPTVTINNLVFDIQTSVNLVDEGSDVTFNITYTGINTGVKIYYETVTQVSGAFDYLDFNQNPGGFFVTDSTNKDVTLTILSDQFTEGTESFFLRLRYGSFSGPILATSATVNVTDLSLTPTITFTAISTTVNEGVVNNITLSVSPQFLVPVNLTWSVTTLSGTLIFAATTGTIFKVTNTANFSIAASTAGLGGTYRVNIFYRDTLVAQSEVVTVSDSVVTNMVYIGSNSTSTNTIAIPMNIQQGDVAILFDQAFSVSSTPPTLVIPASWTYITGAENTGLSPAMRIAASYKVLTSLDAGSTITGMSNSAQKKTLLVFRPNVPLGAPVFAGGLTAQVSNDIPALQSITSGVVGPVIQFAQYSASSGTGTTVRNSSISMNEVANGLNQHIRYLITNSPSTSPAITVGFGADNQINGLASFYLSFR